MVLNNEIHEPVKKMSTFFFSDPVDLLDVGSNGENTLPPSDWVRANHRMFSPQFITHILGGAARTRVDLEAIVLGDLVEARLGIGGRETLEELLVWLREAVVDLVTGCPQGIYQCISDDQLE